MSKGPLERPSGESSLASTVVELRVKRKLGPFKKMKFVKHFWHLCHKKTGNFCFFLQKKAKSKKFYFYFLVESLQDEIFEKKKVATLSLIFSLPCLVPVDP